MRRLGTREALIKSRMRDLISASLDQRASPRVTREPSEPLVHVARYRAEAHLAIERDGRVIGREHIQSERATARASDQLRDQSQGIATESAPPILGEHGKVVQESLFVLAIDFEPDAADALRDVERNDAKELMAWRLPTVGQEPVLLITDEPLRILGGQMIGLYALCDVWRDDDFDEFTELSVCHRFKSYAEHL